MKSIRQLSFLEFFGYLALILGLIIEGYALISQPGSLVGADNMFGGAVVLALAVAFLHDRSLLLRLIIIGLSTLGFGVFAYAYTRTWTWTTVVALAVLAFLVFFFGLSTDVRRNHSEWPHF
ncbi:hypothetical protein [Levilactobacillus suantsaii]|uniref:Uncharacterized protein n=1 Tax=Levilactobacillus suantsaii TaxID=2292255 RepID=A0A4V1LFF9_9LACO|nr:hypothetical protein [Levilactobacillus suantsaii]QMU08151.1 hypothetical protein H3M12_00225 [Levilactobacillus suantsaii]RXI79063.1 hypothetical protein DXH47_04595 [Levilactobacillus suantsaii]